MRKILFLFMLFFAASSVLAGGGGKPWRDKDGCLHYPCPPCKKCDEAKPCPEQKCPDPQPCPEKQCDECKPCDSCCPSPKTITVEVEAKPTGRWYLPLGAFWLDGWGAETGIAYKFPKGVILAGLLKYHSPNDGPGPTRGSISICEDEFGRNRCEPECITRSYTCPSCTRDSTLGIGFTVMIPLGDGKK